jgi:hypothetical protein
MQKQPSTKITNWLDGDDMWQNGIDEEFRCECHLWRPAWITEKPREDQKMMIAFRELIIFFGLVGLSAPGGSHYCSQSNVSQNHDSSPVRKRVQLRCFADLNVTSNSRDNSTRCSITPVVR